MQKWNILILLLDYDTSWHKHMMKKHVLSNQTGFLSGQNLSLAGQMTFLLTKIICRLDTVYSGMLLESMSVNVAIFSLYNIIIVYVSQADPLMWACSVICM